MGDTLLHQTQNHVLPQWRANVLFYHRFIDGIIGIWICDNCPDRNHVLWTQFQHGMQQWHWLEWEFSSLSNNCNYMDLTLTISGCTIQSTLFEKSQNLYLYLPPHSAHPRGPLNSLIFGNILPIHSLCSTQREIQKNTHAFYKRLMDRGHPEATITPLFRKATHNALQYMARSPEDQDTRRCQQKDKTSNTIFLHLQYHPQDPPAWELQNLWHHTVATPPGDVPLTDMKNNDGAHVPITSLTIVYSHPPNLRNQLSIRTIKNRRHAVSSYLT
eukprot:CCRYP_008835-RB/>CCRYP_008835-RB protein AED:0.21 eAED:0.21 QI:0/-1/0/1/-1/0/1/0/271